MQTDKTVIALGTFDGLHPGHRAVISACITLARETRARSMVYTFIENPKSLFGPAPLELMTPEDRIRAIRAMGVDTVEAVHFTRELADLSPEAFIDMLAEGYDPSAFVAGEDYSFGRGGSGTSETLVRLASEKGIYTKIVSTVNIKTKAGCSSEKVSSTLIREALARGDTETARRLIQGEAV